MMRVVVMVVGGGSVRSSPSLGRRLEDGVVLLVAVPPDDRGHAQPADAQAARRGAAGVRPTVMTVAVALASSLAVGGRSGRRRRGAQQRVRRGRPASSVRHRRRSREHGVDGRRRLAAAADVAAAAAGPGRPPPRGAGPAGAAAAAAAAAACCGRPPRMLGLVVVVFIGALVGVGAGGSDPNGPRRRRSRRAARPGRDGGGDGAVAGGLAALELRLRTMLMVPLRCLRRLRRRRGRPALVAPAPALPLLLAAAVHGPLLAAVLRGRSGLVVGSLSLSRSCCLSRAAALGGPGASRPRGGIG